MRLKEIEERLSTIKIEIDGENADLDALEKEIKDLTEERKSILDKAEKRKALIDNVVNMHDATIIKDFKEEKEERHMDLDKVNVLASTEYRSGYLNKLRGLEINEVEQRALTTASSSVGEVVPEQTQNRIIEKVKQYAPLLNEIELLQVPGGVTIPVEGTVADAAKHTEGATITASGDTITSVSLFGYEVTKLLTISKSVKKMSIQAFENWLTTNLAKSLAAKITYNIIAGTGTGEAKGIDTLTWSTTNSVTVAKSTAMTTQNVLDVIALLPGGYDPNAKFLMSKKTLFQDFMPLQDKSKNDLVQQEGQNYFVQGYPVMIDERITIHEAILGDFFEGYKGNMPEDISVTSAFDLKANSFDYLGAAMFDGKPAITDAFVKIVKATS